jgi:hypothetical protein
VIANDFDVVAIKNLELVQLYRYFKAVEHQKCGGALSLSEQRGFGRGDCAKTSG